MSYIRNNSTSWMHLLSAGGPVSHFRQSAHFSRLVVSLKLRRRVKLAKPVIRFIGVRP